MGRARSPGDFHSTRHGLPLQLPGLRLLPASPFVDATSDPASRRMFALLASRVSASLPCVTCVWLYWLTEEVSPNKPGIMERSKREWVIPFRDAPLLMTLHCKCASSQHLDMEHSRKCTAVWTYPWDLAVSWQVSSKAPSVSQVSPICLLVFRNIDQSPYYPEVNRTKCCNSEKSWLISLGKRKAHL